MHTNQRGIRPYTLAQALVTGAMSFISKGISADSVINNMLRYRQTFDGHTMLYTGVAGGHNKRSRNRVAHDKRRALKAKARRRSK